MSTLTAPKPAAPNIGDPEKVKAAKSKKDFAEERDANDLRWVLSTIQGRRFFWRLVYEFCNYNTTGFYPNADFAPQTNFDLGQREIGRRLMNYAHLEAFEAWQQMEREYRERKIKGEE